MVNDIINGLSVALHNEFDGVNIYTDKVEQGFEYPAFFISNVDSSEKRLLGNRAQRRHLFGIHYFPKSETNEENQRVASQLYGIVRQVKLLNGELINGFKPEHEVSDGVLHFFVQYNPIVYYPSNTETEKIGELEHNFI